MLWTVSSWPLVFISAKHWKVVIQNLDSGARLLDSYFSYATYCMPLPVPQLPHLKNGENSRILKIMALKEFSGGLWLGLTCHHCSPGSIHGLETETPHQAAALSYLPHKKAHIKRKSCNSITKTTWLKNGQRNWINIFPKTTYIQMAKQADEKMFNITREMQIIKQKEKRKREITPSRMAIIKKARKTEFLL